MAIKPDVILVFCVPVDEGNNSQDTALMAAAAFVAKIVSIVHHLQPPSGGREIVILGLGSNTRGCIYGSVRGYMAHGVCGTY